MSVRWFLSFFDFKQVYEDIVRKHSISVAHKYFEGGYHIYNESQGLGGVWGWGEGIFMCQVLKILHVLKILKAPSFENSQCAKF